MTKDFQLDTYAAAYLKQSGAVTGNVAYAALSLKYPKLTEEEFADLVHRLAERGQVDVYPPVPPGSLRSYLTAWDRILWFYLSIIACVTAALTVYLIPANSPFVALRWAWGLLFVLLLPGYAALQALFPSSVVSGLDRLPFSVGVSLILDMFAGLLLNYTQWGISFIPVLWSLVVITIVFAIMALVRQFYTTRQGRERILES